jgi:Asp-tRNA(Asn)/Glu-tRNA(Gln) amidotransferase A subunit family amidase
MLFAPAVTMPLMAVQGMPLGAQLMGQRHEDARITAMARWLAENIAPSVAA